MSAPTERLLVLDQHAGDVLADLGSAVRHQVSARVAVVVVDDVRAEQLRRHPRVRAMTDTAPEPAVMATLGPDEQLFIGAWLLESEEAMRPGDGLPWDAPGFDPPDPPDGRSR